MSENIDLRLTIRFDGDEALARAVHAAVDAVLLHERVYYEVPTYCELTDGGTFVVFGGTDPDPLIITRSDKWMPLLEAQIKRSVAELVPDARVAIDWGFPDEDWELPSLPRDLGRGRRLEPEPVAPPVDWRDFADRLARVLADMPVDAYLSLRATGNRYAQVVRSREASHGAMYCEVASNRSVDPQYRMSVEQEALIAAHGWSPPPGNGVENWAKELHAPLTTNDYIDLAEAIAHALSTALSVATPADLKVQAWRDGLSQAFSVEALGLGRLPRPSGSRPLSRTPLKRQSKLLSLTRRYLRRPWTR
ncbi:hypothetical protein [Nocardia sp. NPDC051981]|uniref:TY-Chap domain-containing protein n=1 Tax=Nocardia sp. NPDC051981 TaxID=3155417 RepID=UPI0034242019